MATMTIIRALWYPIKAFTDVVGTFGPIPTGSVVRQFLKQPTDPGAAAMVGPVLLGAYVTQDDNGEAQLESILGSFWVRLQQLVSLDRFDPTLLGDVPAYTRQTSFQDIAHDVFDKFNAGGGFPTSDQ